MKLPPKYSLLLLSVLALPACSWSPPPSAHQASATHGMVEGFIDPDTPADQLPPCVASQLDKLRAGTRFAVIGYRHWASHFRATTYTALAAGTTLHLHQDVLISPAECAHGKLALLLEPVTVPVVEDATP